MFFRALNAAVSSTTQASRASLGGLRSGLKNMHSGPRLGSLMEPVKRDFHNSRFEEVLNDPLSDVQIGDRLEKIEAKLYKGSVTVYENGTPKVKPEHLDTLNAILDGTKKIQLVDTTTRDGDQSHTDARMTDAHVQTVSEKAAPLFNIKYPDGCPLFRGFESRLGGNPRRADVVVNGRNPWSSAASVNSTINAVAPEAVPQILYRGQCGGALGIMPKDVINAELEKMARVGVGLVRVFWALNYNRPDGNLPDADFTKYAMQTSVSHGMAVEGAISYHDLLSPEDVSRIGERYLENGATSLCIKDMGALIKPFEMFKWVEALKPLGVPVGVHTHFVTHMGLQTYLYGAMAGAEIFDTSWSAFAGANGQPAFEAFLDTLGLTHLLQDKHNLSLDDVNNYLRGTVREDLKPVETSSPYCDWRVMCAKLASGAIAHLISELGKLGKKDLLGYVLKRIEYVRIYSGNPALVTPTAKYVSDQSALDVLAFDRDITALLKSDGLEPNTPEYKARYSELMDHKIKTEESPRITPDLATVLRGDFGPPLMAIDPEVQGKVMAAYIRDAIEMSPYEQISSELLDRISDGVIACGKKIIANIRDGKGVSYEDYISIKKGNVSDDELIAYINFVPELVELFNEGSLPLDRFKKALNAGLLTIGNPADWMPDALPAARVWVQEKLAGGWTLPPGYDVDDMARDYAMYDAAIEPFFEHHKDRSKFALPEPKGLASSKQEAASSNVVPVVSNTGISSPITGQLMKVVVNVGDTVEAGQTVAVISAMKMETNIVAECSGRVSEVCKGPGDTIEEGHIIIKLEGDE